MKGRYRVALALAAGALVLVAGLAYTSWSQRSLGGPYGWFGSGFGPSAVGGGYVPGPAMMGGAYGHGPAMMGRGYGPGMMGFGGGELVPQAPANPTAARIAGSVSIREWAMQPETVQVSQGKRLVLTVRNDGTMPHNFAIPDLGVRLVGIAPGSSRTVELNVDKAGSFAFFCDLPGHPQLGQRGTLSVSP